MARAARQPLLFPLPPPSLEIVGRRAGFKLPKFLDDAELRALLAVAEESSARDYALVVTMAYAGLRVSEAVCLRWAHVEGDRIFVERGKGNKQRLVPMNGRLRMALEAVRKMLENRTERTDYVFPGSDDGHLGARGAERIIERLCERAHIAREKAHPHTLRHTFATRVLRSDGNILKVQRLLGHSSVATTQIYTHLVYDDLAEAVAGLD